MERVGADFIMNVTLNTEKQVTGVYAGHPVSAHIKGASALEEFCTTYLDEPRISLSPPTVVLPWTSHRNNGQMAA
ncbi:MAG: hypothetical protein ABIJ86_00100 [Spirochaetota bacterium]